MEWASIEEMKNSSYEGWCWIFYKGRVVEAYRDPEYRYRFHCHSQNVYLTECISAVMVWERPEAPEFHGDVIY